MANFSILLATLLVTAATTSPVPERDIALAPVRDKIVERARQSGPDLLGRFGNKLFFISNINQNKSNWPEAKTICQQSGLEMVIFSNNEERGYYRDSLRNVSRGDAQPWVGAHLKGLMYDPNMAEGFEWADKTPMTQGLNFMLEPYRWLCAHLDITADNIFADLCLSALKPVACQLVLA